jgi:hypothetical protein
MARSVCGNKRHTGFSVRHSVTCLSCDQLSRRYVHIHFAEIQLGQQKQAERPLLMSGLTCTEWRGAWRVVVVCLLLAGCGSPASDQPASLELRAGNGKSEVRTGTAQPRVGNIGQAATQSVTATGSSGTTQQGDEGAPSFPPNIPAAVVKDLASSDARDRYRALDHWEVTDIKAPLDPVFEAMEDDDPAVRAKATAIAEQYWAARQEREKG